MQKQEVRCVNYLNTNLPAVLYEKVLQQGVFVDKSMLIGKLNKLIGTNDCYVCITRPRRFGKTVNASMAGAYYTKGFDSSPMFDSLKISQAEDYKKHQNRYNVIYIDFSRTPDVCNNYEEYITYIRECLKEDLSQMYPQLCGKEYAMLGKMFRDTNDSFIFILDEWDSIFTKKFMTDDDRDSYLGFLRNLLKDQPYVSLAYMTGVLPVAKYSSGSELNMFREYNAMNDSVFESYFGFGENEVRELCRKNTDVSYEELKWWYDGYCLSDGTSLFNPRSVNMALSDGICRNYWTQTGPMNEVAQCVEHNADEVREDIVRMVAGIPVEVKLNGYSAAERELNTRNEILSAMVVYGFLSYHDGKLKIPNHELMEKFENVLERSSMGEVSMIVRDSAKMLDATLAGNEKEVAEILEKVHDREIPFLQYNDENSLSCVITLCYLAARDRYRVEREAKSGKGFCDYLFLPYRKDDPAIILELKAGGTCGEALAQIKEKQYIKSAEKCREVLSAGISYNKKKMHECKIERVFP